VIWQSVVVTQAPIPRYCLTFENKADKALVNMRKFFLVVAACQIHCSAAPGERSACILIFLCSIW